MVVLTSCNIVVHQIAMQSGCCKLHTQTWLRHQWCSTADLSYDAQVLYLGNNSMCSTSPSPPDLPTNITLIDLSNNLLYGSLPADLPASLVALNVSGNSLTGTLPSSWSTVQSLAVLRLHYNQFTGTLPSAWSTWGKLSHNSLQLSITNASLHGHIPQQWVQQFCLAIVQFSEPQVLFRPVTLYIHAGGLSRAVEAAPLLQLPAQRASLNVTLEHRPYSFSYNSPQSICGIPNAARNLGLLWGIFAAVFVASVCCLQLRLRQHKEAVADGPISKIKAVLNSGKFNVARQVTKRVWFFLSDGVYSVHSQVTDIITIHQVFASEQVHFAYFLLAITLLPVVVMLIPMARLTGQICSEHLFPQTHRGALAARILGVLFSPILLLALELAMLLQGLGVPLPMKFDLLGTDIFTFYRLQSCAESFINAFPQSILQSKLYFMGNDPHGVHVYIDTKLFLSSAVGSLTSVLKSVLMVSTEVQQHGCGFIGYWVKLFQLKPFEGYQESSQDTALDTQRAHSGVELLDRHHAASAQCPDHKSSELCQT